MSAVKVIRALLVADAALIAQVPATRIIAGVLPQATGLPALCVTEVSTIDMPSIDAQATHSLVNSRVQVTVMAANYPSQKLILDLVRKACNYERGTIATIIVVSVQRLQSGPDFNDQETGIYMQSIDFRVIFHEEN